MANWLVELLVLLGILAIAVIVIWFVLNQMALPEPINKIVIIVLVIIAGIIGIYILLHMRGGLKLTDGGSNGSVYSIAQQHSVVTEVQL